jgi:hypothetical protein
MGSGATYARSESVQRALGSRSARLGASSSGYWGGGKGSWLVDEIANRGGLRVAGRRQDESSWT